MGILRWIVLCLQPYGPRGGGRGRRARDLSFRQTERRAAGPRDQPQSSRVMGWRQSVPVAACGMTHRANHETHPPYGMRHVAIVIGGIVAGYAVIAIMVALLMLS